MATNYTSVDEALKRDYLPVLQKQIVKKVKTWDLLQKSTEGIKGRDLYIKMFKSFPQGVGPAAAEATLPTPGQAGYKEGKVSVKRNYAVVQFDAMMEKEKNSIVDIIDFEMQAAEDSLAKELNFQLAFGDGSGKRAQVNGAVSSSATVNVDMVGLDGRANAVDFLAVGQYIDIHNGSTYQVTNKMISAVNSATQITLESAVSCDDNAYIYRTGSKDLSMMGIPGIVNSAGTIQTIDPSTDTWWKSYTKDMGAKWSTSDGLFLDVIQETIDEIQWNSNGKINLIYAWPLFQRQYRYAMEAKRRIVNTLDFKEGRKGLAFVTEYGEISIMADTFLPQFKVYFLDTSKLSLRTLDGIHWEEKDGAILRFLERKDVFIAWLKLYAELAVTSRNSHGYWTNTGTSVGDYT